MSQTYTPINGFGNSDTTAFVRRNAALIAGELPPPGQKWIWDDQNVGKRELLRLSKKNIIEKGEYVKTTDSEGHYWETDRAAYQIAQNRLQEEDVFPCGHAQGFRTVDPEKGIYECRYERCDATYDRETVKRVMGE